MMYSRVANVTLSRSRVYTRRWLSNSSKEGTTKSATAKVSKDAAKAPPAEKKSWWNSAELWGGLGALAGWGMSGAAIYDAALQGPEVISLNMTCVLIIYSSLFARWAWIVKPRNALLASCHVANVMAQSNQLRRALEYKMNNGQEEDVKKFMEKAAMAGVAGAGLVAVAPKIQSALVNANLGIVSKVSAADAGPFTIHFWAPMSKWLISGASFMDLERPTDKISLAQYTALTLTGFFFTRYSLLVIPVNYTLCSVNVALFLSSGWHLGRKIKADYIDEHEVTDANMTDEA